MRYLKEQEKKDVVQRHILEKEYDERAKKYTDEPYPFSRRMKVGVEYLNKHCPEYRGSNSDSSDDRKRGKYIAGLKEQIDNMKKQRESDAKIAFEKFAKLEAQNMVKDRDLDR